MCSLLLFINHRSYNKSSPPQAGGYLEQPNSLTPILCRTRRGIELREIKIAPPAPLSRVNLKHCSYLVCLKRQYAGQVNIKHVRRKSIIVSL